MRPIFGEQTSRILEPSPQGLIASILNHKFMKIKMLLQKICPSIVFSVLVHCIVAACSRYILYQKICRCPRYTCISKIMHKNLHTPIPPSCTVQAVQLDGFLSEMKLIQEIGPFFALKVYIKMVYEQKGPPSMPKSTLHIY